ncbi:conserved hypothetical protein [Ricinus communis]|uniref:DUF4283 domain-containing protein n=1 Tax=Ricinus communis TaxID=3988 RepID=B9RLY5_RICCO|nr:conserved hypothetical protein [Ricinus communis]
MDDSLVNKEAIHENMNNVVVEEENVMANIKFVVAWVRFLDMPVQYYQESIVHAIGHSQIFCPFTKRPNQETIREDKSNEDDVQNRNPTSIHDEKSCYSPWMVVAGRPRNIQNKENKKNKLVIKKVNRKENSGSRFAALNVEGDDCEKILTGAYHGICEL